MPVVQVLGVGSLPPRNNPICAYCRHSLLYAMQAAKEPHIFHTLLSSQVSGSISQTECVLISKLAGLSILDASSTKAGSGCWC